MGILKAFCFLLTLIWIVTIINAQQACSLSQSFGHLCNGPQFDVWMIPFFFGVIGLPAAILSVLIIVVALVEMKSRR